MKLNITIEDGVSRGQALTFAGTLMDRMEVSPVRARTDYPILFVWSGMEAIYHATPSGQHSFTIRKET